MRIWTRFVKINLENESNVLAKLFIRWKDNRMRASILNYLISFTCYRLHVVYLDWNSRKINSMNLLLRSRYNSQRTSSSCIILYFVLAARFIPNFEIAPNNLTFLLSTYPYFDSCSLVLLRHLSPPYIPPRVNFELDHAKNSLLFLRNGVGDEA